MAKEYSLNKSELHSIEIEKLIFHIIQSHKDTPILLDDIDIDISQKRFFRDRIADAATGTQFVFIDKSASQLHEQCQNIIQSPEDYFLESSKRITQSFQSHHAGNTSDGAFVVALIRIKKILPLIFLSKIDNRKVITYDLVRTETGRKAVLEEVINTFIEDRRAIQKSALIDLSNHYAWDVLASDRTKTREAIADYFRKFLSVQQRESASVLTRKTVSAVRSWASRNKHLLSESQEIADYKERAIEYFENHVIFDTASFVSFVIREQQHEMRESQENGLTEHLSQEGIAGQTFSSMPNSIDPRIKKNVRRTSEGVKIEWYGSASAAGIKISDSLDEIGKLYKIEIETRDISELN